MKSLSDFFHSLSTLAVNPGKKPGYGIASDDGAKPYDPQFGTGSSDGKKPYDKQHGVYAPVWFAASADKLASVGKQAAQQLPVNPPPSDSQNPPDDPDAIARQIIIDHPDANASAFYNAIQAKGLMLVHKQSDTSGSFDQSLRAPSSRKSLKHGDKVRKSKTAKDPKSNLAGLESMMLGPLKKQKQDQGKPAGVPYNKWADCVHDVQKKGKIDNAYAVCNSTLECGECGKKECECKKESFKWTVSGAKIKESTPTGASKAAAIGATKFQVVLIQEGMGNFNDRFYYSKEAIESAVPVFEGKKIYADHPSVMDEQVRPERSVRDILGHFENIRVSISEDGQAQLVGEVNILPSPQYQWARDLMLEAIDYSKKYPSQDLVGLSINASGDAQEVDIDQVLATAPNGAKAKLLKAKEDGIDSLRICTVINDAISCDLVTEAGAGGKINTFLERGESNGKKRSQRT